MHSHRFDRYALRWSKRFQQTHGCHQLPFSHQVQYPRTLNVGQDAGVGVTPLRALLIDTKVRNLLLGTAQHAALHSAGHDGIDRTPGQPRERADRLRGVEVVPLALGPAIDMSPLGGIGGVAPDLTLLQNHFDHHTLVGQGQVNLSDRLRGLESKEMLIQRSIFHAQAENIEFLDSSAA